MKTAMKTAVTTHAGGFTVIELLISMTLILLALALSVQLLLESQRTFALAGRAALEPMAGSAVGWLTADVHAAAAAQHAPDGALLLTGHPEGTLRWERLGETVWRTALGPGGTVRSRRMILERVTGWSWSWDGNLLTAVLVYRRGSALRYVTTPELPPETLRQESLVLQLHPRRQGRWNRW